MPKTMTERETRLEAALREHLDALDILKDKVEVVRLAIEDREERLQRVLDDAD